MQNISILTFSTKVIWIGHNVLKQVLNLNFSSSGARLITPNFEGLTNIQKTFCPLKKYQLYTDQIFIEMDKNVYCNHTQMFLIPILTFWCMV